MDEVAESVGIQEVEGTQLKTSIGVQEAGFETQKQNLLDYLQKEEPRTKKEEDVCIHMCFLACVLLTLFTCSCLPLRVRLLADPKRTSRASGGEQADAFGC